MLEKKSRESKFNKDKRASFNKDNKREFKDKKVVKKRSFDPSEKRVGFSTFQLRLVHSILSAVLKEGKSLDKAYAIYFAKVKLLSVEQGFIIKQINAMFRRLSFYAYVANLKRPSDFERHIERLITVYCAEQRWPLPDYDIEGFDRSNLSKRIGEAQNDILLNQGCPIWLEELCSRELKEQWPDNRKALGQEAHRFIRVNELKISKDELSQALAKEGVVTKSVKGVNTALEVTSNAALFRTQCFKNGMFEQQDAGSQLIAPFLDVNDEHLRVIDACAGAGGKTLHIASLMKGKGVIIALDTVAWKLDELKKRARRAGAFNIETRVIDSTKVIKRLYDTADRVLIDAPCSGIGVIRRTVDSKWRDGRASLNELHDIQQDILSRYSKMVKVGGIVVYSTCSILPSENEAQVQKFIEASDGAFSLVDEKHLYPKDGFDGFYMAKLIRNK